MSSFQCLRSFNNTSEASGRSGDGQHAEAMNAELIMVNVLMPGSFVSQELSVERGLVVSSAGYRHGAAVGFQKINALRFVL